MKRIHLVVGAFAFVSSLLAAGATDIHSLSEESGVVVRFVRTVETFDRTVLPKKNQRSGAKDSGVTTVLKAERRGLILATGIRNGRFVAEPDASSTQVASLPSSK